MTTNHFQLSNISKNRFVNLLQIVFGATCIGIGAYWAIATSDNQGASWVTILFLFGFGFYKIWSGLGKADRYIEIEKTSINLKKTIFLPVKQIEASELSKIEVFPLKVNFHFKAGTKILLRFGTTYIETNEKVVDALIKFAEQNTIEVELHSEKVL